ncbi:MAG: hypothetical protein WA324_18620 [Bryobacteraceae bacterium]
MPVPRVQDEHLIQRLAHGLRNVERSLHPDVVRIRWSVGEDWSGDSAIFFRVVLSDAASRRDDLAEFTGGIGGRIFADLRLAELEYIPYFNFRSDSEQKRLKDAEWD